MKKNKKKLKKREKIMKYAYRGLRTVLFIIVLLYNMYNINYPSGIDENNRCVFPLEKNMEIEKDDECHCSECR